MTVPPFDFDSAVVRQMNKVVVERHDILYPICWPSSMIDDGPMTMMTMKRAVGEVVDLLWPWIRLGKEADFYLSITMIETLMRMTLKRAILMNRMPYRRV